MNLILKSPAFLLFIYWGLKFTILGIYMMIKKRAVIHSYRIDLIVISICMLILIYKQMMDVNETLTWTLSVIAFIVVIISLMYFFINRYNVYGTKTEVFEQKFIEYLKSQDLKFAYNDTEIKIDEQNLRMTYDSPVGFMNGQIRMKFRSNKKLFYKLMKGFAKQEIETGKYAPLFHIGFGLLCLGFIILTGLHFK